MGQIGKSAHTSLVGVQSSARNEFQGHELLPNDTGDISYRILVPGEHMLSDPDLRDLISQPWVSSWCGPDAHVIGYPIRGGEIYNVVCCCSEKSMQDQKLEDGKTKIVISDNGELVRRFSDWEPRVKKIVGLAGKVHDSSRPKHSPVKTLMTDKETHG